jgi:flavin reductase (DIM6/NTAB) family NADH-FMN oxidoreductase RutF
MSKNKIGNNVFIPMPVTLVGTIINGKANFMTVAGVSRANAIPPKYCIAINKKRATADAIKTNRSFSICLPSRTLIEKTDYCGIASGRNVDKSKVFNIFYGDIPAAPMIEECPLCMECELTETVECESSYLFIGEVKGAYADDSCLEEGNVDSVKADYFLLTMPDNIYRNLGEPLAKAWHIGKNYQPQKS